MCARQPTSAMPKPFLCCERAFCCSRVVMWPVLMHVMSFDVVVMSFDAMWLLVLCHVTWCNAMSCDVRSCDVPCNGRVVCSKWFCDDVVIQSTTPVTLCTTQYYNVLLQYNSVLQVLFQYHSVLHSTTTYYSSTTLYYKVLLQYYSVLQSTTPVLLCTTKYYSSTTLYYKVLLQYYSVLHSTTTYYKVLLQYYSVLQSTTPVLLCTSQYYNVLLQYNSVLQSTTPVLLCTTKYYSSTTLYYKAAFMIEPLFTLRGATGVILQLHQVLHLPHKMTVMIDPRHIWNVIYNARSKYSDPETSPNTAPVTQNIFHDWSSSHMKRHLQCAEQVKWPSNLTKYCACHAK